MYSLLKTYLFSFKRIALNLYYTSENEYCIRGTLSVNRYEVRERSVTGFLDMPICNIGTAQSIFNQPTRCHIPQYISTASMSAPMVLLRRPTHSNTLPMTGINSSLYSIFTIDTISAGIIPPSPVKPPTLFTALKTLRT